MTVTNIYSLLCPVLLLMITSGLSTSPEFQLLSGCTCPGYSIEYRCIAIGVSGFTYYNGSAFDCGLSGNEITLLHTGYSEGVTKICGQISARSLRVSGSHYESQLIVNISQELNSQSVICAYSSGATSSVTVIGSSTIRITTSPPPPPVVQLFDVKPGKLTFNWNPPTVNCSALHYVVNSTGCGNCTDGLMTSSTSIICSVDATAIGKKKCGFAVKSVVCSSINSPVSNRVDVKLKVPEPPEIVNIVARYAGSTDGLLATDIQFMEVNSFNITNDVEGSPLYYSVTFTESTTGIQCGSFNISSFSACNHGVCLCSTSLPSSCFHLNGVITISLSATNRLGRGLSNSFDISTTNNYFDVKLSSNSVVCTFIGTKLQHWKSCSILYGQCQQQLNNSQARNSYTDSVQLTLSTELKNNDCYFWNASNGTFTVIQRGVYRNTITCDNIGIIVAICIGVVLLGMIVATVIIISVIVNHRRSMIYAYDRLTGHSEEYMHISKTITFDLQDKLWTLLKVLEAFKNCNKNIVDAKIDDCNKQGMRQITIECEEDLDRADLKRIKRSLKRKSYEEVKSCVYPHRCSYTKDFPGKPGSLYKFLKAIYDRSQENDHYCIDIIELTVQRDTAKDSKSQEITLVFDSTSESQSEWDEDLNTIFNQIMSQND